MEKLFLAIEVERLRNLVEEKESDNDKLALINDKLDTNLQKKSIETKELLQVKSAIKEQEKQIEDLLAENEELKITAGPKSDRRLGKIKNPKNRQGSPKEN